MSEKSRKITATNIKYLLAIKELDDAERGVRCIDLASRLKVSKPSVHTMVDTLKGLGLVEKQRYGSVYLTEPGREKAARYADSFEIVFSSLRRSLKLSAEDCKNTAYDILEKTPEAELPTPAERPDTNLCRSCNRIERKA